MRILLVGPALHAQHRREALAYDHYHLHPVHNVADALAALAEAQVDLVILAVDDGEATSAIVEALRHTATRLLVLCDDTSPEARARILDAGADDCLGTPCADVELRARVTALLRRGHATFRGALLECGPIALDPLTHGVCLHGAPLALSVTEYRLLRCLLRHAGAVVSREQLNQEVWDSQLERHSNAPDVYISYLRRRLGGAGPKLIRTIRGLGYMLSADAPAETSRALDLTS